MKKPVARKSVKRSIRPAKSRKAAGVAKKPTDVLLAPVKGADRRQVGHGRLDVGSAGEGRVKRLIYPPGFHWLKDMKAAVGTDLCMHAHVGFIVRGEIHIEYADG